MKRIKIKILNWMVKKLYNPIRKEEVFVFRNGILYMNGERVEKGVAQNYKDQAIKILEMGVWEDITKYMKYRSNKKMYEESISMDQMVFGKAMLHNLDLTNEVLRSLAKIKL